MSPKKTNFVIKSSNSMFGKKKPVPQIDKEQMELIKNAQRRVKQKRRLYMHFVIFLIGAIFLIIINTVLGVGETTKIFGMDWFVFAILAWLFLFIYHLFNVFITHKFMGKEWEQNQVDQLLSKQKVRISELEKTVGSNPSIFEKPISLEEKKTSIIKGLTLIAAAAENDALGKNNKLIWHLGDDLRRFKSLTSGHCIIMGRKTYESFTQPLPNRKHIIITRQHNYRVPDGVVVVNSLSDAFNAIDGDARPFVIGGGEIYKQAMPFASEIELTRVHESFDADAFFPKIDFSVWREVNKTFHPKDANHNYSFSFLTYERR